ncbi:nuclear transport factor 2 family protein [Flavobacterium turcicum]|uniref:Nuclear transport factor 2 family protein n=1 Tax=Flavobacterium turcicum TaxID=2764718 RepID=A0ABR7JH88_9FLAO|nr:nuclear transport factor 2 family protein [Flavobacterium turcicum]MBC5863866.1 nuclear transport factor 2 family protein [Flavobacterium turcicum]NHL02186.1 nuclear transport factor 2 family protein [Flavobacterium turcicum]
MRFKLLLPVLLLMVLGCKTNISSSKNATTEVNQVLDNWHQAAAKANFTEYFDALAEDAVFIGTDATENWNKKDFQAYAKPHFDKGKAWSFSAVERHVFFDASGNLAWFDELLNTQMKICRGSGVLVKVDGQWKIKQYVLSMTVPNEHSNTVIQAKSATEDALLKTLQSKKGK